MKVWVKTNGPDARLFLFQHNRGESTPDPKLHHVQVALENLRQRHLMKYRKRIKWPDAFHR